MPSAKKKRNQKNSSKMSQPSPKQQPTAQELIEAADQVEDPEQALHLYTAAADTADTSSSVLMLDIYEKRAAIHVTLHQNEAALADYRAALQLADDGGGASLERRAGLYMYMGQLHQGEEALELYKQAIHHLEQLQQQQQSGQPTSGDDSTHDSNNRRKISPLAAAYCTAAELFLTDLCFADDAEQQCERYLEQALALNAQQPDALQTSASLRLSQCRPADATTLILQAFDSMRVGCQALAQLVGLRQSEEHQNTEQALELKHVDEVQRLPEFEFRCETAKLLLECAALHAPQADECRQAALDVLGSLLAENDQVVEVWVLTGDAFGEEHADMARHYYERALEMLAVVQNSLQEQQQQQEFADEEEEEEVHQQLEDVLCNIDATKAKLEKMGSHDDGGNDTARNQMETS